MASLNQFIRDMERLEVELVREVVNSEQKSLGYAENLAHKYSDGFLSYDDLEAMDHPYAIRHGAPQEDPTVINKHTGDFDAAWKTLPPTVSGGVLHSVLINFSRVADFLKNGTRFMFARPIDQRVGTETQPVRIKNLDSAVGRVFRRFK